MRCPRCHTENHEDAKFCLTCGALLPHESPMKKFFMALLHAFLYAALFLAVQFVVSGIFSFALSFSMVSGHILTGGVIDAAMYETIARESMQIYLDNAHTILILTGLITVLALVISFRVRHKNPTEEMHIRKIPLSRAPWCVVFGIALQPVINLLLNLLPVSLLLDFEEQNAVAHAGGPLAIQILNVVILTPIVEELIFRGLVLTRMRRGMSTALAVLISSALFGAIHGHTVSFLYASVLGVALAWMMLRNNDSVIAPMLCHAGFNGGSYLLQALFSQTDNSLLYYAVILASAAILVLSGFMIFRPIPSGGKQQ